MTNIYMITNTLNDKKYIGKTTNTLRHRFTEHVRSAKNYRYNSALYSAIRKYGEDKFVITLIETCEDISASSREVYWISYYDTYKNGYNSTLGGEGKSILEVPSKEDIISKIQKVDNITALAEQYGVYTATLKKWMASYDIHPEDYVDKLQKVAVGCVYYGQKFEFESLTDAGRWVMTNIAIKCKNPYSIGYNIKRAIERNGTYASIKWYYLI